MGADSLSVNKKLEKKLSTNHQGPSRGEAPGTGGGGGSSREGGALPAGSVPEGCDPWHPGDADPEVSVLELTGLGFGHAGAIAACSTRERSGQSLAVRALLAAGQGGYGLADARADVARYGAPLALAVALDLAVRMRLNGAPSKPMPWAKARMKKFAGGGYEPVPERVAEAKELAERDAQREREREEHRRHVENERAEASERVRLLDETERAKERLRGVPSTVLYAALGAALELVNPGASEFARANRERLEREYRQGKAFPDAVWRALAGVIETSEEAA